MHDKRWLRISLLVAALGLVGAVAASAAFTATSRTAGGKTFYFIRKGTLTPYEVIADHGGSLAMKALGNTQKVQSGTADTAAAQQPAIQAAIQSHAAGIVIAANDPQAVCPSLNSAMKAGIKVVTFDSDANCRQLFINQADTETIGRSQMALLAQLMGYKGEWVIL